MLLSVGDTVGNDRIWLSINLLMVQNIVSMETELKSLEEKIFLLLRLYQDICAENNRLRKELSDTYVQNEKLNEKIHVAAGRLETLLLNLPDNE
jgi:hypothetical protein